MAAVDATGRVCLVIGTETSPVADGDKTLEPVTSEDC